MLKCHAAHHSSRTPCRAETITHGLAQGLRAPCFLARSAEYSTHIAHIQPALHEALCNLQSESRVLFFIKAFKGPGEYITRATDLRDQLLSAWSALQLAKRK